MKVNLLLFTSFLKSIREALLWKLYYCVVLHLDFLRACLFGEELNIISVRHFLHSIHHHLHTMIERLIIYCTFLFHRMILPQNWFQVCCTTEVIKLRHFHPQQTNKRSSFLTWRHASDNFSIHYIFFLINVLDVKGL